MGRSHVRRREDDEFTRACRRLGVRFDHIHIAPTRPEDGALTVTAAESIVTAWLTDHPGGWVKALSNRAAPGRGHHRAQPAADVRGALPAHRIHTGQPRG